MHANDMCMKYYASYVSYVLTEYNVQYMSAHVILCFAMHASDLHVSM